MMTSTVSIPTVRESAIDSRTFTALSLSIALATTPIAVKIDNFDFIHTSPSASYGMISYQQIGAKSILKSIGRIHDYLVKHSVDLDPDIKKLIYENMWELY